MASVEFIRYQFVDFSVSPLGELVQHDSSKKPIEGLPQIFWRDRRGWDEANVWALERASSDGLDLETVRRTMKHLGRYAAFLEDEKKDWRHFPIRKEDQVLRLFRKRLLDDIDSGQLARSTASNCMNSVIQFYRFADLNNLVGHLSPMWTERMAVIRFFDSTGFKRSVARLTTDLKIMNRPPVGRTLEDGLLPLRAEHMTELLEHTARHGIGELHLMLGCGFFTGARLGTIVTLTVTSLDAAREDPNTPGVYLLRAGPGTGISTKGSVTGALMVPRAVLDDLRRYATSTQRLLRQAKAQADHKHLLFLTRNGGPYTVNTVNRLVHEMRGRAVITGLRFMSHFKFHQSRATFGTWLMQLLLDSGGRADVIRVVRDAMFHKDEKTTLGYITFLENSRAKAQFASAFNQAFTGLCKPDWNSKDA